jgi:methionine-S-sulfoxide reductase
LHLRRDATGFDRAGEEFAMVDTRRRRVGLPLATLVLIGLGVGLIYSRSMARQPDPTAAKRTAYKGKTQIAIFAGGCFWCMQPPFDKLPGVVGTSVGYCGGKEQNPSYKQVAYGRTGHTESIKVVYDPKKVSYAQLLEVFWRNMDPTDAKGQFADRGRQYRPAVFYLDETQRKAALRSKAKLAKSGRFSKPIVVEITKASTFWDGEGYHQQFYKKNPTRYYSYRRGSGREAFLRRVWGSRSAKAAAKR